MLSFESTTSAPEGKLFFLGALAGAARAGAGIARAGVARAGVARAGIARVGASVAKAPIKSLSGVTIRPSFQKSDNKTTTITNDYSTINYNK